MTEPFTRKTFTEARQILDKLCIKLDGKPASTNKQPSDFRNPDGAERSWWTANDESCPRFDSPRCRAYLQAYIDIAGPTFFGTGIPLKRRYLHPDRGVMKALLIEGCVTLGERTPGLFELTEKGKKLIDANILPADDHV